MAAAAGRVQRVLLTVDATDARLDEWMALDAVDVIQVQGQRIVRAWKRSRLVVACR